MTYIQRQKFKYFGRIFSIVLIAVMTTLWFISQYQNIYTKNMNELDALNQMEIQALQTQYFFKKQVQEWKNILLRGQSADDLEKYLDLFRNEYAATQASANSLYEKIDSNSQTKALSDKFRVEHKEMFNEYAKALEVYKANQFDAQKSDAEVRGIDREATDVLDEVVSILNDEIYIKRNSILTRLNTFVLFYGIAFLLLQMLFCWLAIKLTAALLKSGLTDKATQIGNRELFINTISNILDNNQIRSFAIFDLNNFKIVNEAFGNQGGDRFLQLLASDIKRHLKPNETLCRVGGDMLGIIMLCKDTKTSVRRTKKIKKTISAFKYTQDNIQMSLTASAGVFCMHASVEKNSQQILNNLYASLQEAKSLGKNKVVVYSPDSVEIKQRRAQMQKVHEINLALEEKRIVLFRQQVLDLSLSNPSHYFEILMRVKDKNGEYQPPGLFIAAAERFKMMESIDRYIIQSTIDYLRNFSDESEYYAINLSGATLSDKTFITFIEQIFDNPDIPSERISFEITETDVVKNLKIASSILTKLKSYGCKIALDDFGTGMSSYRYLTELEIDKIKIDGKFIQDVDKKTNNQAIIRSVVHLAKELNIRTVAEFVETKAELQTIKKLNIDYAQGYLMHKPEFLYQPSLSVTYALSADEKKVYTADDDMVML